MILNVARFRQKINEVILFFFFFFFFQLSYSSSENVGVDSQIVIPENLPVLYGRWLTMLTVRTSLKQVQFIQKTLTDMSKEL